MKILLVNTFIGSTSTGNLTFEIYENNIANGDECIIAYGRKDVKNCVNSYKIGGKTDYLTHCLWTRLTDLNGSGSIKATNNFIEFIQAYKPDVIHLHNIHGYYLNLKLFFQYVYQNDIPIVWTFHDCWSFTGHCPYYSNINCEKWKSECFHCPKKRQHPASYLLDNSRHNYRQKKYLFTLPKRMVITPVSIWLEKEVRQSFFSKCEIESVYNGVDLTVFRPIASDFRKRFALEDKIILLGVAINWVPTKGLNNLIELSKIIPNNYQIVVVGVTPEQKNGLPDTIIGFEKISNVKELVKIYSAADVFVNPSREETFGMVTAEAMACGTPVVVYNATASPELVDRQTGRIVKVGDVSDIYKAVVDVLSIPNVEYFCVERAATLFDKRKNQNRYRQIYKRLVEE